MTRPEPMTFPNLDARCGHHFTYRDFVECSDTWRLTCVDNTPREAGTYEAMKGLAERVLDPIVDRFGKVTLTYAFASRLLIRHIRNRHRRENTLPNTTPNGDQHAGHELNSIGNLICPRRGMAVDLRVDGVDSRTVAAWTASNTPFDRMLFYSAQ